MSLCKWQGQANYWGHWRCFALAWPIFSGQTMTNVATSTWVTLILLEFNCPAWPPSSSTARNKCCTLMGDILTSMIKCLLLIEATEIDFGFAFDFNESTADFLVHDWLSEILVSSDRTNSQTTIGYCRTVAHTCLLDVDHCLSWSRDRRTFLTLLHGWTWFLTQLHCSCTCSESEKTISLHWQIINTYDACFLLSVLVAFHRPEPLQKQKWVHWCMHLLHGERNTSK